MRRGQIVRSLAGRDKGRFYAVLSSDERYGFLADGKLHKLEHPKRKNPRHLQYTSTVLDETVLEANGRLEKALRFFQDPETKV